MSKEKADRGIDVGQLNNTPYCKLQLGDPNIHGHIDAPHAQAITDKMMDQLIPIHTGPFLKHKNAKKAEPVDGRGVVYINDRLRRFLGRESSDGEWMPLEENRHYDLQIMMDRDGRQVPFTRRFMVRSARVAKQGGDFLPVITHPEDRGFIRSVIRKKFIHDKYTGDIARNFGNEGGTFIEGTTCRSIVDLNRSDANNPRVLCPEKQPEANQAYRAQKRAALENTGCIDKKGNATKPYLHIAIHGKKGRGFVIGTRFGETCDPEVEAWFKAKLEEKISEYKMVDKDGETPIVTNEENRYQGDQSKIEGKRAHGPNYHTIQLEIGDTLREAYSRNIAKILRDILREFTKEFPGEILKDSIRRITDDSRMELKGVLTQLKRGDSGEQVEKLQKALATLGYFKATANGTFGPRTEEALIEFQLKNGIIKDKTSKGAGIFGPKTRAAFKSPIRAE